MENEYIAETAADFLTALDFSPAPLPVNEQRFSERAGYITEPPPSVPIPISLIPKKTFIAVPLEEPVIALPVSGFVRLVSMARPLSAALSIVCQ